VAPREPIRLALRWHFKPAQDTKTGFVTWTWEAYTQSGELAMESKQSFDTFTECLQDAKLNGYRSPDAR